MLLKWKGISALRWGCILWLVCDSVYHGLKMQCWRVQSAFNSPGSTGAWILMWIRWLFFFSPRYSHLLSCLMQVLLIIIVMNGEWMCVPHLWMERHRWILIGSDSPWLCLLQAWWDGFLVKWEQWWLWASMGRLHRERRKNKTEQWTNCKGQFICVFVFKVNNW